MSDSETALCGNDECDVVSYRIRVPVFSGGNCCCDTGMNVMYRPSTNQVFPICPKCYRILWKELEDVDFGDVGESDET